MEVNIEIMLSGIWFSAVRRQVPVELRHRMSPPSRQKIGEAGSSKTLMVMHQIIWHYITEGHTVNPCNQSTNKNTN